MATWRVFVADDTLVRQGEVERILTGELRRRWNAPGAWRLEVDAAAPAVEYLLAPGARIEVTKDGTTVFAGPVGSPGSSGRRRWRNVDRSTVEVAGIDDLGLLWERVAYPQPATASPPWSSSEYDTRTGTLSTIVRQFVDVNAGPGALAARQVPGLVLGADPAVGGTATLRGRLQALGDLVAASATAAALRLDVVYDPSATLTFTVAAATDRTATVQFSEGFRNLLAFDYSEAAPGATHVVVGGQGEGTARTFRLASDSAAETAWRRIEQLVDRRDLSVTGELDAAGTAALVELAARTGLSITPLESEAVSWPDDYDVGDLVAVVVDGGQVTDRVSEVVVRLDADGASVAATVGSLCPSGVPSLFGRLRSLSGRLTQLERR